MSSEFWSLSSWSTRNLYFYQSWNKNCISSSGVCSTSAHGSLRTCTDTNASPVMKSLATVYIRPNQRGIPKLDQPRHLKIQWSHAGASPMPAQGSNKQSISTNVKHARRLIALASRLILHPDTLETRRMHLGSGARQRVLCIALRPESGEQARGLKLLVCSLSSK
jgi:hypothetical protein